MKPLMIAAAAAGALLLAASPAIRADCRSDDAALQQFHRAVDDFAKLHRRAAERLAPLRATGDAHDVIASSDALMAALQAARPVAREGDIFTDEVALELRERIARALAAHGVKASDVIAAGNVEVPPDAPLPVVNGRFPWSRGACVWPVVLHALPALPEVVQYRLVGRDLVLVDIDANLVVDILREALR